MSTVAESLSDPEVPGAMSAPGLIRRLNSQRARIARFAMVGAFCFGVQSLLLEGLSRAGTNATLADAIGFFVSAQLNFVLSSVFTWRDRRATGARALWYRLSAYNATAAVSLGLNTLAFSVLRPRFGNIEAALGGVITGMAFTYTLCQLAIFRTARAQTESETESVISLTEAEAAEAGSASPAFAWLGQHAKSPGVLSLPQGIGMALGAAGLILLAAIWPVTTAVAINAALMIFFVAANGMKLYLVGRTDEEAEIIDLNSLRDRSDPKRIPDSDLPVYTILLPVYREASVLKQLVSGIQQLDYPQDKLDVKLLLEIDDTETREAVEQVSLPECFDVLLIPDVGPTGKPRACNYGLSRARGEYLVIYDAEDQPERDQLRKSVAAFRGAPDEAVCFQAKLNYFNRSHNLLTRWFTAEYSLWFDKLLPGLQAMDVAIPLGGTSNHFITSRLRELGGWNSYNVTEDAELGMRIFLHGWKTAILDSTTYEEATSTAYNWIRQRSRWVKGYMQTYLFYMRNPFSLARRMRTKAFVAFHLFFGAGTLCLLINPIYWLLTVVWYLTHLVGIEHVFPWPILYLGTIGLFLGNASFIVATVSGCFARRNYGDVKWALLSPLYWILMSVGAWKALIQLCYKPTYWEKTVHGFCTYEEEAATAEVALA
jgi:cellulose synthase/poly-beta-1,6-N-acetylglucosamine synthase-like glycosyltransferase/putative flippase GtrA